MHPIISALKHHKTVVILVVLEIALTCAIVSNGIFIIGNHLATMRMQTGVADNELVWAESSGIGDASTSASQARRTGAGARCEPPVSPMCTPTPCAKRSRHEE